MQTGRGSPKLECQRKDTQGISHRYTHFPHRYYHTPPHSHMCTHMYVSYTHIYPHTLASLLLGQQIFIDPFCYENLALRVSLFCETQPHIWSHPYTHTHTLPTQTHTSQDPARA